MVRAPAPSDILWGNIGMPAWEARLRYAGVSCALLALFLFWSSPAAILASLTQISASLRLSPPALLAAHPFLAQYLSALLLTVLGLVLPVCLRASASLEGYATHSALEESGMKKVFLFLLLSTLLLPTLLSSSATALSLSLYHALHPSNSTSSSFASSSSSSPSVWQLLAADLDQMVPASSMYVSFMLQAALLATPFKLLQLDYWILYLFHARGARTPQQLRNVKAELRGRPMLGYNYATFLATLAIVLFYAHSAPLVLPAGALWALLRHLADKHELLYDNQRRVDSQSTKVPRLSTHFMVLSAALSSLAAFIFLVLVKRSPGPAFFVLLGLLGLLAAFAWIVFYDWPRIEHARFASLFKDEAPLLSVPGEFYLHPTAKAHRRLIRGFPAARPGSLTPTPDSPALSILTLNTEAVSFELEDEREDQPALVEPSNVIFHSM